MLIKNISVDKEYSNFVQCNKCKSLLKWKSRDGTTGLKGLLKYCLKNVIATSSIQKITEVSFLIKPKPAMSPSIKASIADDAVFTCATDIRFVEYRLLHFSIS